MPCTDDAWPPATSTHDLPAVLPSCHASLAWALLPLPGGLQEGLPSQLPWRGPLLLDIHPAGGGAGSAMGRQALGLTVDL